MTKIAVTGVHGSGKTTLVQKLWRKYLREGKTVGVVQEVARDCPYPLGAVRAQSWIWHEQYSREVEAMSEGYDVVVCDRSLMDNLVYLKWIADQSDGMYPAETFSFLYAATRGWMKTYDVVIRLPLNESYIMNDDDDLRSKDLEYAREIDMLFDELVDPYATDRY